MNGSFNPLSGKELLKLADMGADVDGDRFQSPIGEVAIETDSQLRYGLLDQQVSIPYRGSVRRSSS